MSKAVQFDSYGGIDVLQVRDVPRPVPGHGEVLVQVKAAGINPSEGVIRSGALHHLFPATFPSGQGSDLAGHKKFYRDPPKRIRYVESRSRCPSIGTDAGPPEVLLRRRQSRLPLWRATATP